MLDMNKYTFYTTKNKVIAISTYAGRIVRGVAKCNPEDEFDIEKGKKLAAARCNKRIAKKRAKNASIKLCEAGNALDKANKHLQNMEEYFVDSENAYIAACEELDNIINSL